MRGQITRAALSLLLATTVVALPAGAAHADAVRDEQWHLRFLNAKEAHKLSQGEGVTVAVIDSGVDPHPDLKNNLLAGTDVVSGGKGNGQGDARSHGTGMAGLIAAHGRVPNTGALGIAPRAKILPIRDDTPTEEGSGENLAAGIDYAINHGAKVISISSNTDSALELQEAVKRAVAADIVIVAAAGNAPDALVIGSPARFDGVLAVGATDRSGKRADVSVTGRALSIVAPGVDIRSTSNNGGYRKATGTSGSTAIVAGAVALVRSKYPELSAEEVIHRLTATAIDRGAPGRDEEYGYGALDLVAALTANVPPLKPAVVTATPTPADTDTTALPDTSASDSNGFSPAAIVFAALAVLAIGATLIVLVFYLRRKSRSGT